MKVYLALAGVVALFLGAGYLSFKVIHDCGWNVLWMGKNAGTFWLFGGCS